MSSLTEEKPSEAAESFRVDVFDAASAQKLVQSQRDIRIKGGLAGETLYVNGRDNGHITVDAAPGIAPKIVVMPGAEANISVVGNSRADISYRESASGNVVVDEKSISSINMEHAKVGLILFDSATAKLSAVGQAILTVRDQASGKLQLEMSGNANARFIENEIGKSSIKINAKDRSIIELQGDLKSKFDIQRTKDVELRQIEPDKIKAFPGTNEEGVLSSHKALAEQFRSGDLEKLKDKPELKSAVEAYKTSEKYIDAHFKNNAAAATVAKNDIREKIAGVIEAGKTIAVKPQAMPVRVEQASATRTETTKQESTQQPKLTV
jgi:uncharacterized protein YueI